MDISRRIERLERDILPASNMNWKELFETKEAEINAEYQRCVDEGIEVDYYDLIRREFHPVDAERIIYGYLFDIFCEPEDE